MLAGALSRPQKASADGEAIVVGGEYTNALSVTSITNDTNGSNVFQAINTSSGAAIVASSVSKTAISGFSQSLHGVRGTSSTSIGVFGFSGPGIPLIEHNAGVYGLCQINDDSRGVLGRSISGRGVSGEVISGIGLFGSATTGLALQTVGRWKAGRISGVATIDAGDTSVTVNPGVNVVSSAFVLLSPKTNVGSRALWFTTNPSTDRFTIRMSSPRSSKTRIAWLLVG
jgi:hypothetical protein